MPPVAESLYRHSSRPVPRDFTATASLAGPQLTRLIYGAWQRVPFYSSHWRDVASRLATLRFPEHLAELPVVSKQDLLNCAPGDMLDRQYRESQLVIEKTSGSSGQPMEIYKDRASVRRRSLRFLRALLSCGYRPGQRLMLISTRRSGGLMHYARWNYVDLRSDELYREFQRQRPDVLYGPLSSLLEIAEHASTASQPRHSPSLVVSTAEQLTAGQRARLAEAFHCKIADFYGMTEVGLIAYRRPGATTYQPATPDLLLEYLPFPGEPYSERLIITDLLGGAMPLIRYDTGDLVRRDAADPERLVSDFVGRRVDAVQLFNGSAVSPYRITMRLEQLPQLLQYQVVQRADLALDVYIHAARADLVTAGDAVSAALREVCGDLTLRIHPQIQTLQKAPGKFRPVQSEVRAAL